MDELSRLRLRPTVTNELPRGPQSATKLYTGVVSDILDPAGAVTSRPWHSAIRPIERTPCV